MSESFVADLTVDIPAELAGDFLSKLHYVSESIDQFKFVEGGRREVVFTLKQGAAADPAAIGARVSEIALKITRSYRGGGRKVLVNRPVSVPFAEDPHPLLEAQGELFRYGPGRYAFGPRVSELIDVFDRQLAALGTTLGAVPFRFPSLIGADALDRCKYLRAFPHSLTLAAHLREDLEAIQSFAQTARWNGERLDHAPDVLSMSEALLAPSVCFHYYAWLHDSVQAEPRTIGAVGKCFRFESGNLRGLERLWDFTMREAIFVGTRQHVLDQRRKALDATTALLDEWEIAYDIESATDPFFIEEFSTQATFQLAFDLKFEIRALLPYRNGTLAAGSFNYHQDFFGRGFNISLAGGEMAHTGCIGFGLERIALAFLSQYGLDPARWPGSIAKQVTAW